MDTDELRNFLVLAQVGNITRAAAKLNLTQPALSGQVKRLEAELGTPLFHRQGRGVALTEAGETWRRSVVDALERLGQGRDAIGAAGRLAGGTLAIGGGATSTGCLLPAILQRFHAAHPGVRFTIREAPSRTIAEAVLAGDLDLGVVTLPLPPGVPAARLDVRPWLEDELVLLVPRDHPLRKRRSFHWRDLHEQPLIAFESGSAVRQLLDRQLEDHGVSPSVVMELRSIATIASMVEAGIGLGFVSRLADEGRRGLRCGDKPLARQLALVERRGRARSAALAAFRELLLAWKPARERT